MNSKSDLVPVRRRELFTSDPAEAQAYLGQVYGADIRLRALSRRDGHRPALSHRRAEMRSFALEDVDHDADAELQADATSHVVVLWALSGHAESRLGEDVAVATRGGVIIGSGGTGPVRVRTTDSRLKTVVLEQSLLTKAAADCQAGAETPVRFTGAATADPAAAGAWCRAYRYVEESVLGNDALVTPLILAAAGRLLAATALAAFDNSTQASGEARNHNDDHPVLLRRAIAYLESHAADDVGVGDVAGAVFVTPRALQYMFRRHLDVTPMAYLRRIRLDQVHQELVKANRTDTTVAATAARWGFAHTGRFAVLYRETYGQSPHVTLRC